MINNHPAWHWGAAAPLAPLRHTPRTLNARCGIKILINNNNINGGVLCSPCFFFFI